MPNDGSQSTANRFCISAVPASNCTSPEASIASDIRNTTAVAASEIRFACSALSGKMAMNSATTAGRKTKTLKNAAGVEMPNMGEVGGQRARIIRVGREAESSSYHFQKRPAWRPALTSDRKSIPHTGNQKHNDGADHDKHHVLPQPAGLDRAEREAQVPGLGGQGGDAGGDDKQGAPPG